MQNHIENSEAVVRLASAEEVDLIEPLWTALYDHQQTNGMFLQLAPDAFAQWAASVKPSLGRFACLLLAIEAGAPVGFLAGRTRSLPKYFGGYQVGFISEVFVSDSCRGKGLGRALVTSAVDWFNERGINRVELQVIMNNEPARRLYRQLGWADELIQMVWQR